MRKILKILARKGLTLINPNKWLSGTLINIVCITSLFYISLSHNKTTGIMKVNVNDYYPSADYTPYLEGGVEIEKPKNSTIEVGMLMYDKTNNAIGMVLGNIDEFHYGEVRLDTDGMQSISNLRLATENDFKLNGIRHTRTLEELLIKDNDLPILDCDNVLNKIYNIDLNEFLFIYGII